jgi:glycosyltransferase involved in cell wall biosynthesis
MNTPFFSILIPTRGRPDLLRDALVSALFQDFDNFEVVVSDNFNDERTQKVVNEFRDCRRLRCIRPERLLPMPEHWEFASREAKGTYILFLTDRSVLKRHALKTIYGAIKSTDLDVEVCSWRWSLYNDFDRQEYCDISANKGGTEILNSEFVIADFSNGTQKSPYSLPRGLNSCYRKDLVSSLQKRYGGIFKPINPDFTSAFIFLGSVDSLLYIDQALFISQGLGVSNGGTAFAKTADSYLQSLGDADWFSNVPIKAPLVENVIYQDYLFIQDLVGGTLSRMSINWPVYFEKCYRELIEKTGMRLLPAQEIKGLYIEWSKALSGFDKSVQDEVNRRLNTLGWVKLKARLKGSIIGPIARKLKRKIERVCHHGWQTGSRQSVLEAAGFGGKKFRS